VASGLFIYFFLSPGCSSSHTIPKSVRIPEQGAFGIKWCSYPEI